MNIFSVQDRRFTDVPNFWDAERQRQMDAYSLRNALQQEQDVNDFRRASLGYQAPSMATREVPAYTPADVENALTTQYAQNQPSLERQVQPHVPRNAASGYESGLMDAKKAEWFAAQDPQRQAMLAQTKQVQERVPERYVAENTMGGQLFRQQQEAKQHAAWSSEAAQFDKWASAIYAKADKYNDGAVAASLATGARKAAERSNNPLLWDQAAAYEQLAKGELVNKGVGKKATTTTASYGPEELRAIAAQESTPQRVRDALLTQAKELSTRKGNERKEMMELSYDSAGTLIGAKPVFQPAATKVSVTVPGVGSDGGISRIADEVVAGRMPLPEVLSRGGLSSKSRDALVRELATRGYDVKKGMLDYRGEAKQKLSEASQRGGTRAVNLYQAMTGLESATPGLLNLKKAVAAKQPKWLPDVANMPIQTIVNKIQELSNDPTYSQFHGDLTMTAEVLQRGIGGGQGMWAFNLAKDLLNPNLSEAAFKTRLAGHQKSVTDLYNNMRKFGKDVEQATDKPTLDEFVNYWKSQYPGKTPAEWKKAYDAQFRR